MGSHILGVVGICKPDCGLSWNIVTILLCVTDVVTICSDLTEWKFDEL